MHFYGNTVKSTIYFPCGIVKVSGTSMLPTLKPGQFLLVSPLPYYFTKPTVNDIVLVWQQNNQIVKRIRDTLPNDLFILAGDNPKESIDSRTFGPVPKSTIIAKVIFSLY